MDKGKYLLYDCEREVVKGSNHQLLNLFSLLAEASVLGRTAIISNLDLHGIHNNGKALSIPFSKYLDISDCEPLVSFVDKEAFLSQSDTQDALRVSENTPTESLQGETARLVIRDFRRVVFSAPMRSSDAVNQRFYQLRSLARPSATVLRHVEEVVAGMGEFNIIHVRRNDLLHEKWWDYPGLDRGTRPSAIRRRIARWMADGCSLYIMSDETREDFFEPLGRWYKLYTYRSFPALVKIKEEDNFLLYEIEKALADRAKIRVEMFNQYPQYGAFEYSLFDYPRTGTTAPFYYYIGRVISLLGGLRPSRGRADRATRQP